MLRVVEYRARRRDRGQHRNLQVGVALARIGPIWLAICLLLSLIHGLYSWHYFRAAGEIFAAGGHGGWHVFATHPQFQFGPLTVLVSSAFAAAPWRIAEVAGAGLMLAIGALVMRVLATLSKPQPSKSAAAIALSISAAIAAWVDVAIHFGHLDDVLALGLLAFAVLGASREKWTAAALLLGAAAAAKPWALPMGVLLLAAPYRVRLGALVRFALVAVLPWVPFVLSDARTLNLSRFSITDAPDSLLRLLGLGSGHTPPWDRPAQLVIGIALGGALAARRRWVEVPFVVLAARMLLDPQTYSYYTAGLVVAAAFIDATSDRRWPLLAVTAGVGLTAASGLTAVNATAAGTLRALILLGLIVSRFAIRRSHVAPHESTNPVAPSGCGKSEVAGMGADQNVLRSMPDTRGAIRLEAVAVYPPVAGGLE